ncbi:MAG: transaldolase family protein [Patescibacteria group bacterium]
MKFFVDSVDLEAMKPLLKTGVFAGVTTNPTLLKNDGIFGDAVRGRVEDILALSPRKVFVQSWGQSADELASHGWSLSQIGPQVIIKLPCTREGLEAAARLREDDIKTCITAIYAEHQALLASAVGAAYGAPYLGRMNDAGLDGHALIAQMASSLRILNSKTRVLAASVRSVEDVVLLARCGVTNVTLSPAVAAHLFDEPLTLAAVQQFETDARGLAQ